MKLTKLKSSSYNALLLKHQERDINNLKSELNIYKSIIDSLPIAIYWKDLEGKYLGCNTAKQKQLGLERKIEIFAKSEIEISADEDAVKKHNCDLSIISSKKEKYIQQKSLDNEGEPIATYVCKKPLIINGEESIGMLSVSFTQIFSDLLKEISTLKDRIYSFDNLEYIFKYIPGYIYWKNKNSVYLGCNEQLAKLSNLGSVKDIIGKTDDDFDWGEGKSKKFVEEDKYIMRTGNMLNTIDKLQIRRADGEYLQVRTDKRPLYDHDGRVIGVLAVAVDITDQKKTERKLREEKVKTEQANKIKIEFIRNMEHDDKINFLYEKFTRLTPSNKNIYQGLGLGLGTVKRFVKDMSGEISEFKIV